MKRIAKSIKSAAGKAFPFVVAFFGIVLMESPSIETLSYFCIAAFAFVLYMFHGIAVVLERLTDIVTGDDEESA